MTTCAWLWLYAGAGLMLAELLAPGFVIFFFGLSAATVGLCRAAFGGAFDLTWQLAAFSAFSVLYLVFLRRWLKKTFFGTREASKADFEHELVGRAGKVVQAIRPPMTGRVLIGDAEWTAVADETVETGADVVVTAQSNLTMQVRRVAPEPAKCG